MTATTREAIARTQASLTRYIKALGPGPDSDAAIDAAWQLHRDVAALLPAVQDLLDERNSLIGRLDLARHDPVTGLPTRAAFTAAAEQLLADGHDHAALMLDLVDFKAVNDSHGHAAGDSVLAAVGARLADWAGPAGVVGRLGGDEFAALVDLSPTDLHEQLGKLRQFLEQPIDHDGQLLSVGVSLGAATTGEPCGSRLPALLHTADTAMYAEKGRGRRGRSLQPPQLAAA